MACPWEPAEEHIFGGPGKKRTQAEKQKELLAEKVLRIVESVENSNNVTNISSQHTDPNKNKPWTDLDEDRSFVVVSDDEQEMQVQEVQALHETQLTKKEAEAVPGREDMLTGNVHCTNIELRTSKVLNSLIAKVISGHHRTN